MASFGIIRMQKFKMTDVQGIQKHNQRQGISKSNLDIDYEKSNENYDLMNDGDLKYESEIKRQIGERVKRKTRANSVVLSEFMVTASPEFMESLSAEEQKKYFEQSLDFLQERYGKQNILYAVVHHDEKTPHMHVGIIPITKDERLSAKDIFNRVELQNLQTEFTEHMQQNNFDIERGKPSDKKHLSPGEYKEKMDLEKEIKLLEEQKEKNSDDIKRIEEPKKMVDQVDASVKKTLFGDNVTLSRKDYEKLKDAALSVVKEKYDLEQVRNNLVASDQRVGDLEKENKKLKSESEKIIDEMNDYLLESVVLESILKDDKPDFSLQNVSQKEKDGRFYLNLMEMGEMASDVPEGREWLSLFEDNKEAGNIPQKRLEDVLKRLKEFLDKLLAKDVKNDLKAVKSSENERGFKKSNSWDLER